MSKVVKLNVKKTRKISDTTLPYQDIFSLNRYGRPSVEPKLFRIRFLKRPYTRLGNVFLANLDTLNSKKKSQTGLLKYTVDNGIPKKTLGTTIYW